MLILYLYSSLSLGSNQVPAR